MKKLEILEASDSCRKCDELVKRIQEAAADLSLEYELARVTDLKQIMTYGVMLTPGLVVDGVVKMAGKVPSVAEIKKMIQ